MKNSAAVALGSIKTERKAASSRENGKKGGRPMSPNKMTIFATPTGKGGWSLTDDKGNEVQEGFEYPTKAEAQAAMPQLWPTNSVWHGRRVNGGNWRIIID